MKIGDKVRIIKCDFVPCLVGMEGVIFKIFEFNGRTFHSIATSNNKKNCYSQGTFNSRLLEEIVLIK